MKRVLAALLTGTMVVAMGCVAVQAEEVDKSETIVVYTNNGGEGRDQWLVDRAAEEATTYRWFMAAHRRLPSV